MRLYFHEAQNFLVLADFGKPYSLVEFLFLDHHMDEYWDLGAHMTARDFKWQGLEDGMAAGENGFKLVGKWPK